MQKVGMAKNKTSLSAVTYALLWLIAPADTAFKTFYPRPALRSKQTSIFHVLCAEFDGDQRF